MQIRIKKNHHDAIVPFHANNGDACLDLFSIEEQVLHPGKWGLINTGISIELPNNTEAQIRSRSGLALNYGIAVLNSPGTIDSGYRGEIGVILINHSDKEFFITKGMRIAQMIVKPVPDIEMLEVLELNSTSREDKGFGSSGV